MVPATLIVLTLGLCGFTRHQSGTAGALCVAPQTRAAVIDLLYTEADRALTRVAGGPTHPSHAVLQVMRAEPLVTLDAVVLEGVDHTTGRITCTAQVRATPAAADLTGGNLSGMRRFLDMAGSLRLIPAEGFPDRPATTRVTYTVQATVDDPRRFVYQADDQPADPPAGAITPEEGTVASELALIALSRAEAAGGAP